MAADDRPLKDVRRAQRDYERSRQRLHEAVQSARSAGHSWADVGRELEISRQAAFKRFALPVDPMTGAPMKPRATAHVPALTVQVFELLDADDIEQLHGLMSRGTARQLSATLLRETWSQVVGQTGHLINCRDLGVQLSDGTAVAADEEVIGPVVGHCTIECEAGEWTGRVAVDPQGRVVGILVLPPGETGPF